MSGSDSSDGIFRLSRKILSSDVGPSRTLKLSVLFTLLQETAIAHTTQLGMGRDKTLDRGLLWVVTSYALKIRRMPEYDENFTILSWPGETLHVFFPRFFMLLSENEELLAEGSSMWALMDENTRKMAFPEDYGIYIKGSKGPASIPLPSRIKREETDAFSEFTVPFSYLDINGHMNNARYFEVAEDLMDKRLHDCLPSFITAEFIGEVRREDTLFLSCQSNESSFYLCGEKQFGDIKKAVFRLKMDFA